MKIKSVSINKYKAFQRKEDISIESKNVFIYGENGSGKSSFYYAIKDFFQSSVEEVPMASLRNLYLDDDGTDCSIDIKFDNEISYGLNENGKSTTIPLIADANRLKSFITYKHLLSVHNVKIKNKLDVFDLIINGVLKHFKSQTITNGVELGQLWKDVEKESEKTIGRGQTDDFSTKTIKKNAVEAKAIMLNNALNRLFLKDNADYLGPDVKKILDKLVPGLEIELIRQNVRIDGRGSIIFKPRILLKVTNDGISLENKQPHFTLNEAKLSAIAISIFLGAILRQAPYSENLKILFLDDILIGLDNENRLRLLDLLQEKGIEDDKKMFKDFQIFITTYDRHWYEVAKVNLSKWKFLEFYKGKDGPEIFDNIKTPLEKSDIYFKANDFPACANSLRKVFEQLLLEKLPETYTINEGVKGLIKPPTLDTLINRLRIYYESLQIQPPKELINALKIYKTIVLNPMSHNDIESPIYKNDLEKAFDVVEKLKSIKLPKQKVLIEKNKRFDIEIPSISYNAELIAANNICKIDNNGEISCSKPEFHFVTWSRENIEFAKPTDSPPLAFNNNEKLADILKPAYGLDKILFSINSTLADRGEDTIELQELKDIMIADDKTLTVLLS